MAKINQRLRNFLLKRANYIVPTSPVACEIILEQIPIIQHKTEALFATADMSPDLSNPDHVKYAKCVQKRMQNMPCNKWMVYLGTLSSNRQLTLMIDTLKNLRDNEGIKAGLVIYGIECQSGGIDELKSYAKQQGVLEFILFESPVTETLLAFVVSLADVVISCFPVHSVVRSNSALKTLDYVRSGIPVIGSPIDNHLETIEQSGAGYIAENTPQAFSEALVKLFSENEKERHQRIAKARQWMVQHRDLNIAADIIENALKT